MITLQLIVLVEVAADVLGAVLALLSRCLEVELVKVRIRPCLVWLCPLQWLRVWTIVVISESIVAHVASGGESGWSLLRIGYRSGWFGHLTTNRYLLMRLNLHWISLHLCFRVEPRSSTLWTSYVVVCSKMSCLFTTIILCFRILFYFIFFLSCHFELVSKMFEERLSLSWTWEWSVVRPYILLFLRCWFRFVEVRLGISALVFSRTVIHFLFLYLHFVVFR